MKPDYHDTLLHTLLASIVPIAMAVTCTAFKHRTHHYKKHWYKYQRQHSTCQHTADNTCPNRPLTG